MPDLIDQTTLIVNPQGELVRIPQTDVARAMAQGFKTPSPDQMQQVQAEEDQSGVAGAAGAFGEGALNALTFGTGTAAMRAAGVTTQQGEEARKTMHPVAHAAGTVAGIVAPLIATMGADAPVAGAEAAAGLGGAAREVAGLTAPSLIGKAGAAAAKASGAASAAGRMAVLGATEGALYGGADLTERALLGDPTLTWEKAATELGAGALFGGVLGGGTEYALKGLGKVLSGATKGLESVAERMAEGDEATVKLMFKGKHQIESLSEVAPEAADAIAASSPETAQFIIKNAEKIKALESQFPGLTETIARGDPDTAATIVNNWGKILRDPQRRIEVANVLTDTVNSAYTKIEGALKQVNTEARPAEIERLLAGASPKAARSKFIELLDEVSNAAKLMRAEPDLFEANAARKLEQVREGMWRDYSAGALAREGFEDVLPDVARTPADIFNLLNRTKQQVDQLAQFGQEVTPKARDTVNAAKELRTKFKLALEDVDTWGEAGARQGEFNRAQNLYFTAKKTITRGPAYQKLMQKVVLPTGEAVYEANPRSINSWMNLMADQRGQMKSDTFTSYLNASRNLADQMEKSGFEGAAQVRALIEQASEAAKETRQRAAITQLVKMLQGHEILSSGPAVPMSNRIALEAAKKIPGGVGHIVGELTGQITKLKKPGTTVRVIATLDRLAKKATDKLEKAAQSLFDSGAGGAAAAGATQNFAFGGEVQESFSDAAGTLRRYGGDLDHLATRVSEETAHLHDHAPASADAAHSFAARVVQHLGSKLPEPGPGFTGPLDAPFVPPDSDIADFNRHKEVAARGPLVVLERIKDGTLLPEHLEASQAMYPHLHAEAQQLVHDKLAAHLAKKQNVPRHLREPLGMFLGIPLDHAHSDESMLSAQLALADEAGKAQAQAEQQGGAKPRQARQVKTGLAERGATFSQGNEMRMGQKA